MDPVLVLYQTKHYAIVLKPQGVLSQSGSVNNHEKDMVSLLSEQLDCTIYPVHRLDRETAGIMVYAKTKEGAAKFSALAAENGLDKRYLALIEGVPECEQGTMKDLLYHDARKNKSYVVSRKRNGVRSASLDYTLLKTGELEDMTVSLVDVHLHTGRTHQIRVQFSSRKMPLVGDVRYGSSIKAPMCLFACSLEFTDPFSKKQLTFKTQPNEGFIAKFL